MSTLGKTAASSRVPMAVLLAGLLGTSLSIIAGNGLLGYVVFVATYVIFFYLTLPTIKNAFHLNWFNYLCLAVASICYLVGSFYLFVTNLQPETYIFMSAGTATLLILLISKALQAHGKARNVFLGYTAFFVGPLAWFLSQLVLADNVEMRAVILVLAAAVSLCGMYYAQQSLISYFLQQRSQDRLERTSPDVLPAEQPKPDTVKEQ